MNATKKVLIVDGVYCIAKSLLVMFVAFAPMDVSEPLFAGAFKKSDMLFGESMVPFLTYIWGVPLVLAVLTTAFVWKANGFRWKGLLAMMIAWIALLTFLETIYLVDLLFGWVAHMPT